jgi:hypothetical protein
MKLARWFAPSLVAAALVLAPLPALAAGTITAAKTDLTESSGQWKVFLTVKLAKKPANAHQQFRFIFKQTVLYETFLDDAHGDAEQTRNIPRPDVTPLIESMDINFGDVKGDIWTTTKFDFAIRRDRGYEAGEYKVEVRDADDHIVGSSFTMKLQGKNEVVDRRAMVMQDPGKKKKKPPPDEKPADAPKDNAAAADAPKDKDAKDAPAGDAKKHDGDGDGAAPPPPVDPKKGGCGCEIPGGHAPSSPTLPLLALATCAGLVAARRRR